MPMKRPEEVLYPLPESLTYLQTSRGLLCLNRLTEDQKAAALAGPVERIHELTASTSTTEDQATGKVYRDGHHDDQDHGGRLKGLRDRHPQKPPKDKPNDTKPGKGGK